MPLVDENGRLSGLITIKDIEKVIEFPNAAKDEFGRLLVAGAVGVTSDTFERAEALFEAGADAIVIDTAMVILQGFFVKLLKFVPTSQTVLWLQEILQQLKVRVHFMKQVSMSLK